MWGHMVFLFPKWFLSQMIKPSKSIHLSQIAGKDFIILSLINTPVCVCLFNYMSHICSFFFWRTLILLPYVDYCIEWCRKKISVHISFQKNVFVFFREICRSGIARSHRCPIFSFGKWRRELYCFPQWPQQISTPTTVPDDSLSPYSYQYSLFFTFLW